MFGLSSRTTITTPQVAPTINSTQIVNANQSLVSNSQNTLVEATGGAGGIALTLPDATKTDNRVLTIIKMDATAGQITVQGFGGQTINGNANKILGNQWQFATVQSDGSNWIVISSN